MVQLMFFREPDEMNDLLHGTCFLRWTYHNRLCYVDLVQHVITTFKGSIDNYMIYVI